MGQPVIDDFLADRLDDVDKGKTDLELVIVADGMFITGTAITLADFVGWGVEDREATEETLTKLRNSSKDRAQRRERLFDEFCADLGPNDPLPDDQKRQLDNLAPAYLHLKDVALFVGGKRVNIPMLRIRLAAITSWMPGGIREDELDASGAQ